mgnify:CR=1 FL=1
MYKPYALKCKPGLPMACLSQLKGLIDRIHCNALSPSDSRVCFRKIDGVLYGQEIEDLHLMRIHLIIVDRSRTTRGPYPMV